jgi:hypothetical protein
MKIEQKTASELEAIILKQLTKKRACRGLTGLSISSVETTWQVTSYGGDPEKPAACREAINAVVATLRGRYKLAPHA